MLLGVNATGSTGNSYFIKNDNGEILLLDAGISVADIKQGINYDVGSIVACLVTHKHLDHAKSVRDLKRMGIPVWQPYLSEYKRQKTCFGDFKVECFDVPHHDTPCRAFIITIGDETILYCTDFEFVPYDLSKKNITVMLIEMNYQSERIADMDSHRQHTVLGHSAAKTTLEFVKHNSKRLHTVLFCHMSKSGSLDRDEIAQIVPDYIPASCRWSWCIEGETYNIDSIPF